MKIEDLETVKANINRRLTDLEVNIKVDTSFIIMLSLLLEEIEKLKQKE